MAKTEYIKRIAKFIEANPKEAATIGVAILGCVSASIRLIQSMVVNKRAMNVSQLYYDGNTNTYYKLY